MARHLLVHGVAASGADYSDTYGLTFEDLYGAIGALVIAVLIAIPVVYACMKSASRQNRGDAGNRSPARRGRRIGTCPWCGKDVCSQDDVVETMWSAYFHAYCHTEMIVVLDL